MNVHQYLLKQGYKNSSCFSFEHTRDKEVILSTTYEKAGILVAVDHSNLFTHDFSYKRYCQKQNEWMLEYKKVYRFIETDIEMAKLFLPNLKSVWDENEVDYVSSKTYNREEYSIDPSPLEYYFEDRFAECYGESGLAFLAREYSIIMKNGKTGYLDYVLIRKDSFLFGIEENGVRYHHPFLIKQKKYADILMKQNSVVDQGGTIYRWDTESVQNPIKIVDEIRDFFGDITQYKKQSSLQYSRKFRLYHHQKNYLVDLHRKRKNHSESALVVLPTGTGKTQIALEDIVRYGRQKEVFQVLFLVPSRDLKRDWEKNIKDSRLSGFKMLVKTYAKAYRDYQREDPLTYDYIVVDEAHHAVAPTIKKLIRYYQPEFILGLTATDKRLDEKRLEDVFGTYNIQLDLKEAMEKGILCPIRAFRLKTNIDLSEVRFNQKDYYATDLQRSVIVPSRDELIADTLQKYFGGQEIKKSGIVFCVNVMHARDMAKRLCSKGFNAVSVDGSDKKRFEKIDRYMSGEIQILCTCSLLTEGWDAPHTEIVVMARPTLSKVLYTQQLGRGTRNAPGKSALYLIDVVDNYGAYGRLTNRPWSIHALLGIDSYKPFMNILHPEVEFAEIDTIYETEMKLAPIDIHTMQEMYGNHFGEEQLARELFVSTGTIKSWVLKRRIVPDVEIPMGRTQIRLFSKEQIPLIREKMGLTEHTEETIVQDFWEFINKGDYSFSYKMAFIISLLDHVDLSGEADVDEVLDGYQQFYLERMNRGVQVDRPKSPYNTREILIDKKVLKRSMLDNPFEKFERKRFMYHAKDLKRISIHHRIWNDLTDHHGKKRLIEKMQVDMKIYFENI